MLKWIGILLVGLMSIAGGYNCWKFNCYYHREIPIPHFSGIIFIAYGVALVVLGAKRILIKTKDYDEYMICPACQHITKTCQTTDNKCPKCGENIEALKGFYERHPELKEAVKSENSEKEKRNTPSH
jgi:uncharacterized C2H2 Zn-finger protein